MATKRKKHGKPFFMAQHGNVKVPVYKRAQTKNGISYITYIVRDHSQCGMTGKSKLWTFADLKKAKQKADEIAQLTAAGELNMLSLIGVKRYILNALEATEPTGMRIDAACHVIAEACLIIPPNEILDACRYWAKHRPQKPFVPKLVKDASKEFLSLKANLSDCRVRTLSSIMNTFVSRFGNALLHEVDPVEVVDFINSRKWAAKTHNDFVGAVSLLYKTAIFRNWAPKECNITVGIERRKLGEAPIHVFEPSEARQILERLTHAAPELVPFTAIWMFGGVRKFEISRMDWSLVNRGLHTGWIEMPAKITKTKKARMVPVMDNLKLWLMQHTKTSGSILPVHWLSPTKSAKHRLSELQRFIAKKTGVPWKSNAPRHSFGSYYFKLIKDPGAVVSAMGTSIAKFEKHYWSKTTTITDATAKEWFNIVPTVPSNVVSIPKTEIPAEADASAQVAAQANGCSA